MSSAIKQRLLQSAMSRRYTDSLSEMAREHYIRKLQCLYSMVGENEEKYLESLDPYKHPEDKWVDDVSKWRPIEYPDLYMYLIEAPGEFTLNDTEFFKTVSPKLEDMFVKGRVAWEK